MLLFKVGKEGCLHRVTLLNALTPVSCSRSYGARGFIASEPSKVGLADITTIPTGEGRLYLAVVLDLFSRKVVGWAMRDTMAQELTLAALRMAITSRRPGPGLLHHADRGSQYAAHDYRRLLPRTTCSA